jgi:hypothetical protein
MGVPTVEQGAALFNNDGFFQDAFHLCIIEEESKTNIAFGWEVLDGPFKVTNMKNNTVFELDYKNPYELYQNAIEAAENTVIIQDNHNVSVMSHPLALMENGQIKNIILPDDISKDGHIKFLRVDLRQGEDIYILRGNHDSLIQGVKDAMSSAMTLNAEITVFSCFTREFLLDDKFSDEIEYIDQKYKLSAEGTLSFGEFSNHNDKKELRIYAGACIITS